MSLYHPNRDITALLSAAKQWAKRCLIDDGSLLGQHQLWTLESLTELDRALVQNPLVGDTSYIEKLRMQLADVCPSAAQLMAELHWILLLFPHNIKPQTKREFFREIWELSEEPFDSTHPLLEDIVLEFAPEPQHPRVNGG